MPGPHDPRIFYHTSLDMVTDCVFPAHLIDLSSKNVLWISVQPAGVGAISLQLGAWTGWVTRIGISGSPRRNAASTGRMARTRPSARPDVAAKRAVGPI